MTTLDKNSVAKIHADIRAALDAVAAKHNLSIAKTHITYSDSGFKFTGEFGSKDVMGDTNAIYYNDMKRHGWKFGLSVEDIGKTFKLGSKSFKIEGMRGYKFVVGKNLADDKLYKIPGVDVEAVMPKAALTK